MLTYLCATGGEPDVRVINGNGKGTPRDELPNFVVPHDIKKRDLFFDNVQGDFFQYESWESRAGKVTSGAGSGGEWIPYCHSGLRQRSKFMTSLPRKYKPKEPAGKNATQTLAPSTIFETVLTGASLRQADAQRTDFGEFFVSFALQPEASGLFEEYTRENQGQFLTIVLDKEVISSPRISAVLDWND